MLRHDTPNNFGFSFMYILSTNVIQQHGMLHTRVYAWKRRLVRSLAISLIFFKHDTDTVTEPHISKNKHFTWWRTTFSQMRKTAPNYFLKNRFFFFPFLIHAVILADNLKKLKWKCSHMKFIVKSSMKEIIKVYKVN